MAGLDAGRNGDNLTQLVMEKGAHNGLGSSCVSWLPHVVYLKIADQ